MTEIGESPRPKVYGPAHSAAMRRLFVEGTPRELALQKAEIFANEAVARRLFVENKVHSVARAIIGAGQKIIKEKGWNLVAQKGNLAEQLKIGGLEYNQKQDLSDSSNFRYLGQLLNVTDVLPEGCSPGSDGNTPQGMFELFLDFGNKLKFLTPKKEKEIKEKFQNKFEARLSKPPTKKFSAKAIIAIRLTHATSPLDMEFDCRDRSGYQANISFYFRTKKARKMIGQKLTS